MSRQAPFHLIEKLHSSVAIVPAAAWARLACLLLVSVFLTLWLTTGNVDAGALFQSPQSPAVQPPVEQAPVAQPPVEQPPAEQPPAEQAPLEQPPVEQAPVEQPPAEAAPAEAAPVAPPPVEQPASDIAPPAAEPIAPPVSEPPAPEPVSREREEAPRVDEEAASPNLILDQVEFIDTVVVSGAYLWLCCGVSLFLFVPLLLLFVYIRGRSKMIQEQNF